MKQNFLTIGILLVTSILSMSSFSIRENPQDRQRKVKAQKHIVIEKIDDEGNKVKLDTVLGINDVFVWNGDTIGGKSFYTWTIKEDFNPDSLLKTFNINIESEIDENGENKIIVLKSGKGGNKIVREFITDGDSTKTITVHVNSDDVLGDNNIMFWNDEKGNETFFAPNMPDLPNLPNMQKIMISGQLDNENSINLNDPGIISYKKKKNKDGTEKITIIRKQVDENKFEKIEKIIMAPGTGNPDIFFGKSPVMKK